MRLHNKEHLDQMWRLTRPERRRLMRNLLVQDNEKYIQIIIVIEIQTGDDTAVINSENQIKLRLLLISFLTQTAAPAPPSQSNLPPSS
jgi:hypothetical protein